MRKYAAFLAAFAFLAFHVYQTPWLEHGDRLLRVADEVALPLEDALPDLFAARVVFVGELHDQSAHHAAQLRVLRAFHEADRPVALGLEMFRSENQRALDRWVAGEVSLEEFVEVYYDNWSAPWPLYAPLLLYAREHGIPTLGLNLGEEVVRQVARGGFASLSPEQVGELPAVRCDVDAEYEGFIRRALGMHGRAGRTFTNFCEAQLLWDTAMAARVLGFLDESPDHAMVVLAGSGHAWKRGIPDQISRIRPIPLRVIVPEIPGRLHRSSVTPADADYLWLGLRLN